MEGCLGIRSGTQQNYPACAALLESRTPTPAKLLQSQDGFDDPLGKQVGMILAGMCHSQRFVLRPQAAVVLVLSTRSRRTTSSTCAAAATTTPAMIVILAMSVVACPRSRIQNCGDIDIVTDGPV